jgi:predicted PurR-regulated permease PerM
VIPAVGFLIGLIPALIVAAVTGHSFISLLCILGALIVCNLIDNYYLTPKLVGNRVNISALASFVGLFAGGLLWGIIGMFLSIPILGVLRIVFSSTPALRPWGELLSDSTDYMASSIHNIEKQTKENAA